MDFSYGSVCSGIEAASVAWAPLKWRCAWLAEIEPFPSAVLAHHFPTVPNFGDMTLLPELVRSGKIEAPNLLVGGIPCQPFSVAGERKGADDERNLTTSFVELLDAIDQKRKEQGKSGALALVENVPGLLSDKTNAFGCLLSGLAGIDEPLRRPEKRAGSGRAASWPRAGMVVGRRRRVAWCVLDAQFFGVPQRRRRVFLLATPADAGGDPGAGGLDPSEILALGQGVRGDPSPREEQRQGVAPSLAARARGSGGLGTDVDLDGGLIAGTVDSYRGGADENDAQAGNLVPTAFGGNRTAGPLDVATACNAHGGPNGRCDFESETFVVGTLSSAGGKAAGSATQQDAESGLLVVGTPEEDAACRRFLDAINEGREPDPRDTKISNDYWARQPLPFDTTQITSATNRCQPEPGDPCHPLAAEGHPPAIAFSSKDHGADAGPLSPTLRAAGHDGSHANAGAPPAVAFHLTQDPISGDPSPALSSGNGQGCATLGVAVETLQQQGYTVDHASPQEADAGEVLRAVREEVGAEAFAEWGLGILDSLQPPTLLQPSLLRQGERGAEEGRGMLGDGTPPRTSAVSERTLRGVREAGRDRRTPPGWKLEEQLARQLGTHLSRLPQQKEQAAWFLRALWKACEGLGVLRQALSTVQEVGRCHAHEGQPTPTFGVRRLSPVECERLMGFPDGWTAITYRGKPACDGPRYKALGNSMAVVVMRWLGERLALALRKNLTP